jgi:3-phosphoshikimate 1-carboxyvinyltransferase
MIIKPAKTIKGTLSLPGDKSISHRAAILAALAGGTTRIENFASGADCASTLSCLKQLGVEIQQEGSLVVINGRGRAGLKEPAGPLDCGNSGSTMRMLAGVLAGQSFTSILTGDASLSQRPMNRIIEPLEQMGAAIKAVDGHAPLTITGNFPLKPISYALPKASAQLKSCLLLAGLSGSGETEIIESIPTRDHTERMLPHFGIEVTAKRYQSGEHISIDGGRELKANGGLKIPGDISSAAFFVIAAAALKDSRLHLKEVGLNPSRRAILSLLGSVNAGIEIQDEKLFGGESAGDILVRGRGFSENYSNRITGPMTAAMIDEIPILAVLGTQLENGFEIRDAQELRFKESDRIKSTVENLKLMGAAVEEFPDGLQVHRSRLAGAKIDSFGDHRIAMAFAVAGLLAEGETEIMDAECVDISYPGFFDALEKIVIR